MSQRSAYASACRTTRMAGASSAVVRAAVKIVRCRRSSRRRRVVICGMSVANSAGSSVTARPEATSAPRMRPSSLRWRMSGSKFPTRLQTLRTTASRPVPCWPAAHVSYSHAASRTDPRFGSAGWSGCKARSTSSRRRSWRCTSRWRATGTGSYSTPTTRSTARERRSASAGAVSRCTTSTCSSGAVSARCESTAGSRASAGVWTNVIRSPPRGASLIPASSDRIASSAASASPA